MSSTPRSPCSGARPSPSPPSEPFRSSRTANTSGPFPPRSRWSRGPWRSWCPASDRRTAASRGLSFVAGKDPIMIDGLLLLHAFPLDASMWEPQLNAGWDLPALGPNLPGFGGEPGAGDVLTMEAAADHAARVVEQAGLRSLVVCGLSMGGYVALAFWRKYRPMVGGLVLANTRAGADDEAGRERRRQLAERLLTEGNFLGDNPPPLLSVDAPTDLWDRVKEIVRAQPAEAIAAASLGM